VRRAGQTEGTPPVGFSTVRRLFRKSALRALIAWVLLLHPSAGAAREHDQEAILSVVRGYVAAIYARDYAEAYRWISAADRRLKSQADYEQDNDPFTGPSLILARRLAREIVVRDPVLTRRGHRVKVRTQVSLPNGSAEEVARLVLGKDGTAEAPLEELKDRLAKLEALIAEGKLPRMDGEETWTLVQDPEGWRIFLDWGSGVRIRFATRVPDGSNVTATFDRNEVLVPRGETIRLRLRVRNYGAAAVRLRAIHRVEPDAHKPKLDLVQCGFLFPAEVPKDGVDESPVVYFVDGDLSKHVRRLRVTLEFQRAD